MSRDPRYDVLFEPVSIGPKTMPNRFYQTPHCTSFGVEYPASQARFRGVKAEGGWGVVNTEYCSVHPESDDSPWVAARLWDERDVRNLARMVEEVHAHGALAGVELWFGGAHYTAYESRLPARGVSQIPSEIAYMTCPYEMSLREIRELQGFYVAAARRAVQAGFDIVNVHGAECGSITQQFLMPYYNKRGDEYGGSFENRARFWRETIEQVKDAVGDSCAIAARLCLDTRDGSEDGIRVEEEGIGFVELCDHLVDFWDVQVGGATAAEWGDDAGSSRFFPENFQAEWVVKLRPHTTKPIVGVGRFTNPDTMVAAIRSRQLDVIGAARPSIADPFLPRKIEEGRLDDIRECIGCNVCVSRYSQGARIVCTQNATVGEEYRRGWHPERFESAANADRDVLVVGAGPAGMECALVLGRRGMRRVHLVDAASELGGAMRWIPQLPGLGEWARVVDHRRIQLDKLRNVEVLLGLGADLDPGAVEEYGAELVVVATGATWAADGLSGITHAPVAGADASLPWQLTPDQIMAARKPVPAGRVLVYDCDGYFMGVSLAEMLALDGRSVTLVTPFSDVAPYTFFTGEGIRINRRLRELRVEIETQHVVTQVEPGIVRGAHAYDANRAPAWAVEAVVLVTQRLSNDSLWLELDARRDALAAAGVEGLYRIGDCVAPRFVADAIFDGHRLGREIDSGDPAVPLPYLRENLVLEPTVGATP
jgi:dimethylamine/trimethylamine dehydrogenase